MALDWSEAQLKQLQGDVRPGILLRVASDPIIRLWSGAGDLSIATDLVEDDAANIYTGFGEFGVPPSVNQLVNGLAQRVDFALSGVAITSEIAALASSEADAVRGAAANLGFLVFDKDWQVASPTAWLWDGLADSVKVSRSPGANPTDAPLYSIGLSVGSIFTGRRRPTPTFWTDPDQKRRSADDRFCDRVRLIAQGATKRWPD